MKKIKKEVNMETINEDNRVFLKNSIVKLVVIVYDNEIKKVIDELKEKYHKSLILRRKKDKKNFNLEEYFEINEVKIREIIMKKLTQNSFLEEFKQLKMEFLREHISLLVRNMISMLLYIEIKTDLLDVFVYVGKIERLENEELAEFLLYL